MPLMRAGSKLLYYAHVPKCAGSALEHYLTARFGDLAFVDTGYMGQSQPWSQTSPQHIDRHALARLFPPGFIDASFAVVRHPVARIVSAWHFQLEQEGTVPDGMTFSDWLTDLPLQWAETPYAFDNHTRPMSDIVPEDATVFYLEHKLEALIPWLNATLGESDGPTDIGAVNVRSGGKTQDKIAPSAGDLALIAEIFAVDFERFGYSPDSKAPPETNGVPCPLPKSALPEAAPAPASLLTRALRKLKARL